MAKCHPRGSVATPCILPCPISPPGAPSPGAICAAPVMGCAKLMDFQNECFLHNYNCNPTSGRKWTLHTQHEACAHDNGDLFIA